MTIAEAIIRLIAFPFELAFTLITVAVNAGIFTLTCAVAIIPIFACIFLFFLVLVSM